MIADRQLDGLPLRIHYPEHGARLPIVVFSHGLGGSRLGYGYLGKAFSDAGYVSIHPSHRESAGLPPLDVAPSLETLRAAKEAIDDPRNWEARPRDVARVMDGLAAIEALVPALAGRLDASRIAIAGHSYGAYTTLLCAGARLEGGVSHAEPRAQAFIALSPPGNGSRGLTAESWREVTRPVLCVTGTQDAGLTGQPPEWRLESFNGLPPGNKWLCVIEGAEHFTFSGGRPRRPANPAHLAQVEAATRWFLDRQLRGVEAPRPW